MKMKSKYKRWIDKKIDNLSNKTIIITGCNSGIGFYTALFLSYKNAKIIMACRNLNKAQEAKEKILLENPCAQLEIYKLDVSSLESIQEFVKNIKKNYHSIDILINNAGVFHLKQTWTENHFDIIMATNYLGPYLLSELLMPILKEKIIFTTSIAHKWGKINYEDFYSIKHYKHIPVYANSKLAISKYFMYLVSNEKRKVQVLAAHPGISSTNLLDPSKGGVSKAFSRCGNAFLRLFMHSAVKASLSLVYAAGSNKTLNGDVYGPRGLFEISGYPKKRKLSKKVCVNVEEFIEYTQKILQLDKN